MREKLGGQNERVTFDVLFLFATLTLLAIGTVMVYSSSFFISKEVNGAGMEFTQRRFIHLGMGIFVMCAIMWIDYRRLLSKPIVYTLLAASMISLVLCFIPGMGLSSGGAKRWVRLGIINYQASELLKISMILYLTYFLSRQKDSITNFSVGVVPILIISGISAFLVLIEPDFGTAGIIFIWSIMMLFLGGIRWSHLGYIMLVIIPAGIMIMVLEPYRMRRLLAFVDPWKDMQGISYQIVQSLVAFSKGGVSGLGLGEGTQKLFFLPAPHTDFILAVVGEEIGFIGVAGVIIVFGIWIWRGLSIARTTHDTTGAFLALAAVTLVALQAIINMGVAMSLFPTTGVALPFFSYGGTTLITTMIASGLVLSVSRGSRS